VAIENLALIKDSLSSHETTQTITKTNRRIIFATVHSYQETSFNGYEKTLLEFTLWRT